MTMAKPYDVDEYGLTAKERAFADYFLETGNRTEAYMDAFDVDDRRKAGQAGSRLMKRDEVQNYLAIARNKVSSERIASAEEVLEFFSDTMRAPSVDMGYRISAAKELAKRYGLDKKVIEASVETSGNFEINIFGEDEE